MCWFWVSILPLVQGECAVWGRKVIPNSFVQFMNSLLIKAVPRLCTIDWGTPNESIQFSTADCSLSTGVSNGVYHKEARKCLNDQETRKISITGWVKKSLVIYVGCAKRGSFILPSFQRNFISVLGLWFVALASQAISSECGYPVKHARPVVESFCSVIGFWGAHVSTHFIVLSEFETW